MLVWSPKCACSVTTIWFFRTMGLAREARKYGWFPHKYRIQVYYKSDAYQAALDSDFSDYRFIRVFRDPYSRAASSYKQAIRLGTCDDLVSKYMKRRTSAETGYSFTQFLESLQRVDLSAADIHIRPQSHPVEAQFDMDFFINISKQDLFAGLRRVERQLGLPKTRIKKMRWTQSIEARRHVEESVFHDRDVSTYPWTSKDAWEGPWPRSKDLLTDETRGLIRELYDIDFTRFAALL